MGLGKMVQAVLGKLPDTTCETCLQVRYVAEQTILAIETAMSRQLGFKVDEDITDRIPEGVAECYNPPVLTGQDVIDYRLKIGVSQEVFADRFLGGNLARLQDVEAQPGEITDLVKEFSLAGAASPVLA